jgi:nitrogen fixation protein NifU and related proteins
MTFIYSVKVLEHSMKLRDQGIFSPADAQHETDNPLCGDNLKVTLRLDTRGCICRVGWEVSGCAITRASASLLGEYITGRPQSDLRDIRSKDVMDLLDVTLSYNRTACALLPLKGLVLALLGPDAWSTIAVEDEV